MKRLTSTLTAAVIAMTAFGGGIANAEPALPDLIPAPVGTEHTDGPDTIADNGIHLHYVVNGAPADVVAAYKGALQGQGWKVTTIVTSGGGNGGGAGATYTGTHDGGAYGVFDGGGFGATTYVNVCVWPSQPAEPNCGRG